MSAIVDAIENLINNVIEAVEDLVKTVWDFIVVEILEPIFALFGIEDETVVTVQRITSPIFSDNVVNVVQAGITRAILKKIKADDSFFPYYIEEIYDIKAKIRSYFRYADLGIYINGLPDMRISGTGADFSLIQAAVDDFTGSTTTVLSATSQFPLPTIYFKYDLQSSHDYHPWDNTLTMTDPWSVEFSDWIFISALYNLGPDNYTITITRPAAEAKFWIDGPNQITEGDTATFTIKSNRPVPAGETLTINLAYTGTAVDATDYTEVASVDMLAGTQEITVDIVTAETTNANRNFTISIDTIPNTGGVFEMVTIDTPGSQLCTITDDDTLRLTLNDVIVQEANTTIQVDVKLESAASGAFSVDYDFTDLGSIVGGVDYDNTTGTLNFAGTGGEVQSIMIDIYADVADDDREQFEVFLTNSTDVDSIDISIVSTVTILDGTGDPVAGIGNLVQTITKPSYISENSMVIRYEDDSNPPGEWVYWIYPFSAGTYPSLNFEVSEISNLEMLPIAVLRRNKISLNVIGNPEYLSTKNLVRRIGYDVDTFLDSINANPDIADVDDAYINYAMAPNDVSPLVSKMLYLTFFEIVVSSALTSNIDEFRATFQEGDIKNAIVWKFHTYTQGISGVKTTVGEHIHEIEVIETVVPAPTAANPAATRIDTSSNLKIHYQVDASTYDSIVIETLNEMSSIDYGGFFEVALCKVGDDEFTIPVSWHIFRQLSAREQMQVYQFLLRVDFTAINITEIAWYQSPAFLGLFKFVLIVLTIISWGAASSFTEWAYALIKAYVINYAIGELIVFVAKETGNDELAALAGIVAIYYTYDLSLFNSEQLLDAEVLLNLGTNFATNLLVLEGAENQKIYDELKETIQETQDRIEGEKNKRQDIEEVAVTSEFLASIKSTDSTMFPAIQGQYMYNQLYNYDSLIGDFYDNRLRTGVK